MEETLNIQIPVPKVGYDQLRSDVMADLLSLPGVLKVDFVQNVAHVLVADDADPMELPATYLHESGYEVGISYTNPARLQKMEEHKEIERLALEADPSPYKSKFTKVQEYLASKANQESEG